MIPADKFPDLASNAEQRTTGFLMALGAMGRINYKSDVGLHVMVTALARLVDGVFIDYQAAREAYYRYYTSKDLGGTLPISAALVPMFHHIENCLSNMERVREMADAVRTRKLPAGMVVLIDKTDWKIAEAHESSMSKIRNDVQHNHNDLKNGKHVQGAINLRDSGHVVFGSHELALVHLAKTLQAYRRIANKAVQAIQLKT